MNQGSEAGGLSSFQDEKMKELLTTRHFSWNMSNARMCFLLALLALVGLVFLPSCQAQLPYERYKVGEGETRCRPGLPDIYTGHKGILSDGSAGQHPYSGNRNCRFIIDTEISGPIRITFNRFDTEKNRDLVIIYDGPDELKDNEIARFSGQVLPEPVLTPYRNQTRILIRWFSDGNNAGAIHHFGWEFSWAAPLCGSIEEDLTMPYGLISHGMTGFDETYGPNSNCSWRGDFSSLPDPLDNGTAKARFWLTRISLGEGDRLLFYAGTSIYSPLAAEIVGPMSSLATLEGTEIEVFSDKVLILFQSDNNGPEMGGFDFYWPSPQCEFLTTRKETSGKITDGSPMNVPYVAGGPYHACNWNFNTIPSRPFILSFYYFGIWSGDVLNVYSGHAGPSADGRNDRTLFKSLTGTDRPESIKVSTNPNGAYSIELLMDHRSLEPRYPLEGVEQYIGFGAAWDSAYCHASEFKIDPGVHSITDGSPIGVYYEPGTSCSWLIDPPFGGPIRLKFNSVRIRRFYDFVWVYGGNDTNAPLLAEISGDDFNHTAAFPVDFDVHGDFASILIKFKTHEEAGPITVPQYGFRATWSAPYCGKVGDGVFLTEPRAIFTDGSGEESFIPRSNCLWVIRPGYSGIRLILWKMKVRSGQDFIRVYEGDEPNPDAMLVEWSVQDYEQNNRCIRKPPYTTFATGPVMLVEFVSADGDLFDPAMDGWELEYTPTSRCNAGGPVLLTEPRGVLTDGSEPGLPYAPFTNCTWIIAPEAGSGPVTITIEDMVTNTNIDLLDVYAGSDPANLSLLARYSGNYDMENYDTSFLSATSENATYSWDAITLKFISDCGSARTDAQRAGWRLRWNRFTLPPPSPSPPPPPPPPPKRSPPPPPPPPPRPPPPPPRPPPPPPPLPPFPGVPKAPPPPPPTFPSPPTPLSINPFDPAPPPAPEATNGMSQNTLIGIIVTLVVVVLLAILVIIVACCWLKKPAAKQPEEESKALFSPVSPRKNSSSKRLLDLEAIEDVDEVSIRGLDSKPNSPDPSKRGRSPDAGTRLLPSDNKNQRLVLGSGFDHGASDEILQWTPPGTPDGSPTKRMGERPIWEMQSPVPTPTTGSANNMLLAYDSPPRTPSGGSRPRELEMAVHPMWPPAPPGEGHSPDHSPPRSPFGNQKLMRVRSVSRSDLKAQPLTPPMSPSIGARPSTPSAGASRPRAPEVNPEILVVRRSTDLGPRSPLAESDRPSTSPAASNKPPLKVKRNTSWRPPSSTNLATSPTAQQGQEHVTGWE